MQPPPSKTQLVTPKTTPDKRVAESSTTTDLPSGAGVKAPQKLDLTGTQVTPKKIMKDANDGVPHGFCKLTETRLRDKLIAAENIIKSATDITPHDVRWKDKLTKEWIETSQFFKADTMNALEKLNWQWVRDRNLPSDRRF